MKKMTKLRVSLCRFFGTPSELRKTARRSEAARLAWAKRHEAILNQTKP
jgi:hypothetical protein